MLMALRRKSTARSSLARESAAKFSGLFGSVPTRARDPATLFPIAGKNLGLRRLRDA